MNIVLWQTVSDSQAHGSIQSVALRYCKGETGLRWVGIA